MAFSTTNGLKHRTGSTGAGGQALDENFVETGKRLIRTGMILPYGGATAPDAEWLLCDGSQVSRTTYAALFAVIGTAFGVGNGTTTFNLPDCRARIISGKDLTPSGLVGSTAGNSSVTLTGSELPAHTHSFSGNTDNVVQSVSPSSQGAQSGSDFNAITSIGESTGGVGCSGTTGSTGSGAAFSILNPVLGVNWLIKT